MRGDGIHHEDGKRNKLRRAPFIVLDTTMLSGVTLIDDQHIMLVDLINTLHHNMRCGYGVSVTYTVFKAFRHHAGVHHEMEKTVLDFCEPAYAQLYELHYHEVCRCLAKAENMLRRNMDPMGLLDFLKIWWLQHKEVHGEYFRPGCSGSIH